jgi:DNA replicative helicase MCM subunit Mcm2 (Cdc46/Mcm family)
MILADRGIMCINEFNKLNNIDKELIEKIMYQ